MGPPEAAGRWSLVDGRGQADAAPGWAGAAAAAGATAAAGAGATATVSAAATATAAAAAGTATAQLHSLAVALLDRYGVLTREAVASEEVIGGFSAVYPILRAMEESGRIRRGYFVDGLGAAQFALPGAVDRLRSMREAWTPGDGGRVAVYLVAAADPANPYGAALAWPRRGDADRRPLQRAAGAYVVLVDGAAALYLERGGHSLQTLPASDDPAVAQTAFTALSAPVEDGRFRELVLSRIDGEPVAASRWREPLEAAGFVPGYRGHVLRPSASRASTSARF
jgi:ATP-dependent Lhr-like helicase